MTKFTMLDRTNGRRRLQRGAFTLLIAATIFPAVGIAASQPKIQIVSGAEQQTSYRSTFPEPLVVWVATADTGNSLEGISVRFTASDGIALSAQTATTDRFGLASVSVTGLVLGTHSVQAEIAGHPSAMVNFETLKVEKAVLTIVPGDHFSSVGSIPAMADYTIRGFVNDETLESAQVTGTPILTTAATSHSRDANYAIKGGVGTLSAPNYRFVPGFGTLVLVGSGKADANGATASYDADGTPITLSSESEAANAVRKAFLEQVVSAPTAAQGHVRANEALNRAAALRQAHAAGEVKAAAVLVQRAEEDTFSAADAHSSVKPVSSLAGQTAQVTKVAVRPEAVRGALVSTSVAGTVPTTPIGNVRPADGLSIQANPDGASRASGTIRTAFPPTAR